MSCRPREERALAREKAIRGTTHIESPSVKSSSAHWSVSQTTRKKKTRAQETMTRDTTRVAFPRVTRFFSWLIAVTLALLS